MKSLFESAAVIVAGALLGSFLGKLLGAAFSNGRIHDLLTVEKSAGLHPTHLDLSLVDFTFGFMFHFNVMSIVGILLAALLYKRVIK